MGRRIPTSAVWNVCRCQSEAIGKDIGEDNGLQYQLRVQRNTLLTYFGRAVVDVWVSWGQFQECNRVCQCGDWTEMASLWVELDHCVNSV